MQSTTYSLDSIRSDFPVLERKVRDNKPLVYLDNAATAQKPIQVIDAIIDYYKNSKEFKNLKIIDTGKDTMTGGRLLRLKPMFVENENFFMTYGDGLCNLNLDHLKNLAFGRGF